MAATGLVWGLTSGAAAWFVTWSPVKTHTQTHYVENDLVVYKEMFFPPKFGVEEFNNTYWMNWNTDCDHRPPTSVPDISGSLVAEWEQNVPKRWGRVHFTNRGCLDGLLQPAWRGLSDRRRRISRLLFSNQS